MRDNKIVLVASTTAIALSMIGPASGQEAATPTESMDEVVVPIYTTDSQAGIQSNTAPSNLVDSRKKAPPSVAERRTP